MPRELLFSITKKDFDVQTMRAGGKGGQAQNKKDTGVRIVHRASGASGEGRDSRSQAQNKKAAFERCIASTKFQAWYRVEVARHLVTDAEINAKVDKDLQSRNLQVEVFDGEDWVLE